ncbi:MAG: HEPN domain-containing protein [Alphaproteobacteria bacterium]|nr:HEPN domain-containing protein [Alphaproteobacteria bacterium]MCB9686177.1 HEPN domain-containing protein [Alphaproteobacteria bacterium]MCB9700068.1 HEPN domain-containing protein [Alphaproteobacteria bacterium]MCB9776931.1 HEPN domain-containing protein [Alphaproteobacteria bacterium]
MSTERRCAAFLDLAAADLDAAEVLARVGNQYAAYHVQQAVEKVLKALLLLRGIEAGTEHRLDVLSDRLPEGDMWRDRLEPVLSYSAYATTFRYPTPGGRIVRPPPGAGVLKDVAAVRDLVGQARADLARPPPSR